MAEDLLKNIEQMSKERGIAPETFFSAIKEALLAVSERYFDPDSDPQVEIDREKGIIQVYITKTVVKDLVNPSQEIAWKEALRFDSKAKTGDVIRIYLPGETLGRIAAQTAKQIILHKLMKAEQQKIYDKYLPLTGTLLSGEIRRVEKDNVIVDVEQAEAIIPPKELSPKDSFKRGDIAKFVIKRVFPEGKGPLILGSRYMNTFVAELIKKEVPEVAEGIVKIFSISREPGIKTKIAVYSTDNAVDPVGAIVGMNGNRVLSITKELNGERIDVISWSKSPERFISSALTPAKVLRVRIVDEEERRAEATVADDALSAAIGRKGINIKLASKLTQWHIQLTNKIPYHSEITQKKL